MLFEGMLFGSWPLIQSFTILDLIIVTCKILISLVGTPQGIPHDSSMA